VVFKKFPHKLAFPFTTHNYFMLLECQKQINISNPNIVVSREIFIGLGKVNNELEESDH